MFAAMGDIDKISMGRRIRELAERGGFTGQLLADEVQRLANAPCTRTTVVKWMQGTSVPLSHRVKALCQIFNVSADFLLYGTEDGEPQNNQGGSGGPEPIMSDSLIKEMIVQISGKLDQMNAKFDQMLLYIIPKLDNINNQIERMDHGDHHLEKKKNYIGNTTR